MKLYLASASPRRRELLEYMGIPFETAVSDAEEDASGSPEEVAMGNAMKKGEAVSRLHPDDIVLAADTVVCLDDGRILGKPRSREEAFGMLRALSGAAHRVVTGVAVFSPDGVKAAAEVSRVVFDTLTDEEIWDYIATGEPMDKAGAYALQGGAGVYVERVEGSVTNIIGLPTTLVRRLLRAVPGFTVTRMR
ncbi:MAG: septum formation protein Maf [Clostridia bacterium]|nr:septum formation protein Maf [Clostridia bacterium]